MRGTAHRVLNFGAWSSRDGRTYQLTWDSSTGWLMLDSDRVARVADEERLQNLLLGWEEHGARPNSIAWLVGRLDGAR